MAEVSPSEVPIRPAATIVLVRDAADGLEVLMVRRNRDAVFMGDARVFPGGRLEDTDSGELARSAVHWGGPDEEFPWRAAALRELFEEAGVVVGHRAGLDRGMRGPEVFAAMARDGGYFDADALEYFANWVTPLGPPRRFDARFYITALSTEVDTDDSEVFDAEWVAPGDAIRRSDEGEWLLEFPTRATLKSLASHPSVKEVMEYAASVEVSRIAPRIRVGSDGEVRVMLAGDTGFDQAPA